MSYRSWIDTRTPALPQRLAGITARSTSEEYDALIASRLIFSMEERFEFMGHPSNPNPSAVDPQELRHVLGSFATGVTVMTTRTADGERLGSTVSSFNSVSLNPPLVLFSLARTAQAFAAWEAAEGFAVNILAEDQTDVSNRFARAMTDKWNGIAIEDGPVTGYPLIPGALATMECRHWAHYNGGDHLIIVGRVVALQSHAEGQRPLLFYGSRYRSLDAEHQIVTPHEADIWLHGW